MRTVSSTQRPPSKTEASKTKASETKVSRLAMVMSTNPDDRFKPHVTVATVVEHAGKYLLVEERIGEQLVLNQPAGHLEANESLIEAAIRETLEETAWEVSPVGLLGANLYTAPNNGVTYYRTTFIAQPVKLTDRTLDTGIERAVWLTPEEVQQQSARLRSPMVLQAINRHQQGLCFPLELLC